MNKKIHILDPGDYEEVKKYFLMRTPHTCENAIAGTFLWSRYYDSKYFYGKESIIWILEITDGIFTVPPLCKKEDLKENFAIAEKYFHEELHQKMVMYLVDEEALEAISPDPEKYEIIEERQFFDYVYNAQKLRTLSGKKYHKKKNHVNAFLREYEGRWEYRTLSRENRDEIMDFLAKWKVERKIEDPYHRIESEAEGIRFLLYECENVPVRIGGIYVDGELNAFSIASKNENSDMIFVHIEKANPEMRGLYPVINQQFQMHEFPDATEVNREDDMGLEGLRKSKLSYHPIRLLKKYTILEKD